MKKFLSLLMSVLLVFSAASVFPMAQAAQGREYYIDSENGDDTSDGGMYDPWRTTANLEGLSLEAGDKILFKRGGSYPCELTLTCEGTPENPIVISSYGDGYEIPGDGCTQDFFGNPITSNNIGCCGGSGENGLYQEEDIFTGIIRIVRQIFCRLKVEVGKLIDDIRKK